VSGCVQAEHEVFAAAPNALRFANEVYPILLRDCGFPQCHGDARRPFLVLGPGRSRLGPSPPEIDPADVLYPVQSAELQLSYERARSMLTRLSTQDDYLLLRKPLGTVGGGVEHAGLDALGQDVYRSREDPAWQTLQGWALEAGTVTR
jgi:hypothetical protein